MLTLRLFRVYWRYLMVVLKHKWFVLVAGWRVRAPLWRLVIHDWPKFLPSQFHAYAVHFFGGDSYRGQLRAFDYAVVRHVNACAHHWEYWVPRTHLKGPRGGRAELRTMPMPEWAMREMVADWMAASRSYSGQWPTLEQWPWLERQFEMFKERLDKQTFVSVMALIMEVHREMSLTRVPFWRRRGSLCPYGLSFSWSPGGRSASLFWVSFGCCEETFGWVLAPTRLKAAFYRRPMSTYE